MTLPVNVGKTANSAEFSWKCLPEIIPADLLDTLLVSLSCMCRTKLYTVGSSGIPGLCQQSLNVAGLFGAVQYELYSASYDACHFVVLGAEVCTDTSGNEIPSFWLK